MGEEFSNFLGLIYLFLLAADESCICISLASSSSIFFLQKDVIKRFYYEIFFAVLFGLFCMRK